MLCKSASHRHRALQCRRRQTITTVRFLLLSGHFRAVLPLFHRKCNKFQMPCRPLRHNRFETLLLKEGSSLFRCDRKAFGVPVLLSLPPAVKALPTVSLAPAKLILGDRAKVKKNKQQKLIRDVITSPFSSSQYELNNTTKFRMSSEVCRNDKFPRIPAADLKPQTAGWSNKISSFHS